jgi:hypothetical protein
MKLQKSISKLETNFARLTGCIMNLNRQGSRIQEVEDVCAAILAPDPELAKANASLAELRAHRVRIGRIKAVTTEWDDKWRFLTMFRGDDGYSGPHDGFDLRLETQGLKALKEALTLVEIPLELCDLNPPPGPITVGLGQRQIYIRKEEKTEKKS